MSMYSKANVLKKSSFNFIMHMLNTVLWGRQRHNLNGYFLVNDGNILTATGKLTPEHCVFKKFLKVMTQKI